MRALDYFLFTMNLEMGDVVSSDFETFEALGARVTWGDMAFFEMFNQAFLASTGGTTFCASYGLGLATSFLLQGSTALGMGSGQKSQ